LTTLPSMRRATALARLDASSCALISLPDDLAECAALEDLVVHRNPDLVSLPPNLGALQPRLRGVWVRECGLATLPSGLTAAVGLADLDAGACRLRGLPDGLGGPGNPRLRTLRVGDNIIASLPRSLARADALEVLDVSGNALTDVDVAASTRGLVELRASRNPDLAELPRGLGRGGALRVLHAAACGLEKLSCDLGKHLVGDGGGGGGGGGRGGGGVGGALAWSVDVRGNPFPPWLRRRVDGEVDGVYGALAYLASAHDELALLPPDDAERREATRRRLKLGSREAPPKMVTPAAKWKRIVASGNFFAKTRAIAALNARRDADPDAEERARARHARSAYARGRRERRHSISHDATRARPLALKADATLRERLEALEEEYRLRAAANKARLKERAKRGWGALKKSVEAASAANKPERRGRGLFGRENLMEAIARATEEKARRDEVEFQWIHDVDVLRALSFEQRCALARACRKVEKKRGETFYSRGDDGDDGAVIVFRGRVQLKVTSEDGGVAVVGDITAGATLLEMREKEKREETASRGGAEDDASAALGGVVGGRLGANACVGLECLLTGAPRAHTMLAKSPKTTCVYVPRDALAKILDDDDRLRARTAAATLRQVAEDARILAKSEKLTIKEHELRRAADAAVAAHKDALAARPPPLSTREALLRAECARQLAASYKRGWPALEAHEREEMESAFFRRVKVRSIHWFPYDRVGVVNAVP